MTDALLPRPDSFAAPQGAGVPGSSALARDRLAGMRLLRPAQLRGLRKWNGLNVVEIGAHSFQRERTWRERWLTRPWRPWRRWTEPEIVPPPVGPDEIAVVGTTIFIAKEETE